MDILRAVLDGIAMAAIFNGLSAVLALLDPRCFLDAYPKGIRKAAPQPMTRQEHHVNNVFSVITMGACVLYGVISGMHTGTEGFGRLFLTGYINWIIVNLGDFLLLDCLLIQGKFKSRIVIPGTEGHPDYEFGNWMKHLGVPEHFVLWPFVLVPVLAAAQSGIILLLRLIFG